MNNPTPAELRAKIEDLMGRIDRMSHFELLGVTESAGPAEIAAAYLRAVKQYHPDRMAGLGLGDMRASLERVMARISDANSVLSDPARRAEYLKNPKGGEAARARALAAVEAEMHFQKGDMLLKRGDLAKAEEEFVEALKLNPEEPEHQALVAWIRFCAGGSAKDARATEALRTIGEAVRVRPRFVRGHYFMGELWKHKGDVAKATKAFRSALEIEPSHMEAQRELRLITMRKPGKDGGSSGGGGFFDRLKKR